LRRGDEEEEEEDGRGGEGGTGQLEDRHEVAHAQHTRAWEWKRSNSLAWLAVCEDEKEREAAARRAAGRTAS